MQWPFLFIPDYRRIFLSTVLLWIPLIVEAQSNPACLRDWSYFVKSNKCFKIFGGEFSTVRPTVWSQAEDYCASFNGGHLASFHSDEEVNFVVALTQRALWDDGGAAPIHVGLSYVGNNTWEWTDGSPFNYIKWWNANELNNNSTLQAQNPRGILYTHRKWAGTFWIETGATSLAFPCQMPPSNEG